MGKYEKDQINEVMKSHDKTYKYTIKISGSSTNTKWMSITEAQLKRIRAIL